MVALLLITLVALLQWFMWFPSLWGQRRQVARVWIGLEIGFSAAFIYVRPGLWSAAFSFLAIYQIVNLARIIADRVHADYLRRTSRWTGRILLLGQLVAVLAALSLPSAPAYFVGLALAIMQCLIALMLYSSTQRHLHTTKTLQSTKTYTDKELPSVSVLIPARNETDELHRCLEAMVASTYPKLEIIVLDDCSQNKHTPEIIRSFAQHGVRFIAGRAPDDNWLAKNYAYEQLAEAASGDYLLFCGVDLQMAPGAIRELITTMLEKQKTMLSILPQNHQQHEALAYMIQPLRYAWELCLPRRLFNRPAVLSTCWIITRTALEAAGSFKAASRSITPESYLARTTALRDGYSFLRSNMLVSDKSVVEQQATAVRLRYPQLRRRPELVGMVTAIEVAGIAASLPLLCVALATSHYDIALGAGMAYGLAYIVWLQVTGIMYGFPAIAGIVLMPLAVLYDVILLHYSMYRYEFKEVRWKERNICLPVMHYDAPQQIAPPVPSRG